jgi:hypothetical protein
MASNYTNFVDVPMVTVRERANDRRDRNVPMRQAQINKTQDLHNKGQGPAAFVDFRTLNGLNNVKPKDKRLRMQTPNYTIGGSSSSNDNTPAGFSIPLPSAPTEPDVPPMASVSYNDLSGPLKSQVKKPINYGIKMSKRRPRIAKVEKPVSRNNKRKRVDDETDPNPLRRPKPFKTGVKRMRENDDEDPNPLIRRPPPKPDGRLKKKPPPKTLAPLSKGNTKPPPPPPPSANAGKKMGSKVKFV